MTKLKAWKVAGVIFVLCAATATAARAQTFKTLANFDNSNGGYPAVQFVQGRDGSLYGVTTGDGAHGGGTFFRLTQTGILTTLYNFCAQPDCADGGYPEGTLVLGTDGNFYGTALHGGNNSCQYSCGTLFKITSDGRLTTIYQFDGTDGANPVAGLIQAADGDFYGTTVAGGNRGNGTLFKVTGKGKLTTLYTFCSQLNCSDGAQPTGNLVQGVDGSFYGTTSMGGTGAECNAIGGCGTVFRITADGKLTTLHDFCTTDCTDGFAPWAGLLLASDGNFFGTTTAGGSNSTGGAIFKITPKGELTTIYGFSCNSECEDGNAPFGQLTEGTNGALYGTTSGGGVNGYGTIFRIMPRGSLTTLYNFDGADGDFSLSGIGQATSGIFYGMTFQGGTSGIGTAFSLNTGLGPFVSFVRSYGKVGQTGGILGQGFTGTTGVSLNGIPASFTVISDTFIKATVPAGATTGYVTVATPSGTLTSNVPFHVLP